MTGFWLEFEEFEVKYGTEATLREMFSLKRSVLEVYNTKVNMMASAKMKETSNVGTISDLASTLTHGQKDGGGAGADIMFIREESQSQVNMMASAKMKDPANVKKGGGGLGAGSKNMFIRGESASSKPRGKARRERTRITSQQLQRLEESYEENHYRGAHRGVGSQRNGDQELVQQQEE